MQTTVMIVVVLAKVKQSPMASFGHASARSARGTSRGWSKIPMRTPTLPHLLTFPPLSLPSACPRCSRPLVRRRPGRAGSRSTPSRLIRASPKWSRAHLTSINPTDTAASTSRRAASLRSRAKGKNPHTSCWNDP